MEYTIEKVLPCHKRLNHLVNELLEKEGICRDKNLDYTCAITDKAGNVIATGSCFGNTLRCFAVDESHQGEGLLNQIVTHLMEIQITRGNTHLFVYTKCESAGFFRDLGYYIVAEVPGIVSFLENRNTGFSSYLQQLKSESPHNTTGKKVGAVVMNANPFTLGHQYLVEQAAADCDILHLFIVSEDMSIIPASVRVQLVKDGTAHLSNVFFHKTGSYLISSSTFPSYFLKEAELVCQSHAKLDVAIFTEIAKALNITCRYAGEEPTSMVTGIYNQVMQKELPRQGIECKIFPRKQECGMAISASTVRQCIHDQNWEMVKQLVPRSTFQYFQKSEAQAVIQCIQSEQNLIHY